MSRHTNDLLGEAALPAIARILDVYEVEVSPLAGDGSNRRYFRVFVPERNYSYVLMKLQGDDARQLALRQYPWMRINRELTRYGVRVPKIRGSIGGEGLVLIEDLGDTMLESRINFLNETKNSHALARTYRQVVSILEKFQGIRVRADFLWCQRQFDAGNLGHELTFFWQHFGATRGHLAAHHSRFLADSHALCQYLGGLKQGFTHRDFHSRNLMVVGDEIFVIDFQDARRGPLAYDFVSLFFDPYVSMSFAMRQDLLMNSLEPLSKPRASEIQRTWRAALLQRLLKAIGSFSYFTMLKKPHDYRPYIATSISILKNAQVKDPRWPFLSGEFLDIIAATQHP